MDAIENFDNEKEKPVVSKKKLTIEDFVSFCTGSRYITHNLMRVGTIDFRHFEQDSSPGVKSCCEHLQHNFDFSSERSL